MSNSYVYARDLDGHIFRSKSESELFGYSEKRNVALTVISKRHYLGLLKILKYERPYWERTPVHLSVERLRNRWSRTKR